MNKVVILVIICVLTKYGGSFHLIPTRDLTEQACNPKYHPVTVEDPTLLLRPLIDENGTYVHNQDCRWLIKAPKGKIVEIGFAFIDLEPIHPCVNDNLTLYDSNKISSDHQMVMFCGEVQSPAIHSSYTYMLVIFKTGNPGTGTGKGFEARFSFIDVKDSACSSGNFVADNWANGGFSSPNWGTSAYPLGSKCTWVIKSQKQLRLEFLSFDVQPKDFINFCPAHNVTVYDVIASTKKLLGTYCGNMENKTGEFPDLLGATGESLEVQLHSNTQNGGMGFRARFLAENTTALGCSSSKPSVIDWAPGLIIGPLSNVAACSWRLITKETKMIILSKDYFDLPNTTDCHQAHLEVYDGETHNSNLIGKFCGNGWEGDIVFSTNIGFLEYYSNQLQPHQGFQLKYLFYDTAEHACSENRPIELTQSNGIITSPNYENGYYPNFANCQWWLKAPFGWLIRLNILDFHLEDSDKCRFDYLEVNNGELTSHIGTYCGRISPPANLLSTLPGTYLTFISDSHKTEKGFKISFSHQYSPDLACTINRPASMSHQPGDIISHGYEAGEEYKPDSLCSWLISSDPDQVISLTLTDFMIEDGEHCEFDYVEIFDGMSRQEALIAKVCGQEKHRVFHSTGMYMYVYFESNSNTQSRGFHLEYHFEAKDKSFHLGFLPGLLVAIVFLGICILLGAYCRMNKSFKKFKRWISGSFGRRNRSRSNAEQATTTARNTASTNRENVEEDFVPVPVRRIVTPPSNVDNMQYFAIADYAPPTYEEATNTRNSTEGTVNQINSNSQDNSINQSDLNVHHRNEATSNQNNCNRRASNQNVNNAIVTMRQPSTSSLPLTQNDVQVNNSSLGNADMGMGILQTAGVYTRNNNNTHNRNQTRNSALEHRRTFNNTAESLPSISMSSMTMSTQENQREHPNLTFTSSVSNNGLHQSGTSSTADVSTTFTDVTENSNIYNPVYTALHNRSINSNHPRPEPDLATRRVSTLKDEQLDTDESIYDSPKDNRSLKNPDDQIMSKLGDASPGERNKAFMKEPNVNMDPEGIYSKTPSRKIDYKPAQNVNMQSAENGAYVNMAFHRVNSVTTDTEI